MKTIQWFPGHMTKAMRMMEDQLKLCDGIIYVLDARCPLSSFNPKLRRMFGDRPIIYLLNKADLADGKAEAFASLIKKSAPCVKINAFSASARKAIEQAISAAVAEKKQKLAQKGYDKTFRFMVAGVPNTGKSTVINLLAGSKRAQTGDKAGVTRGKQWISCGSYELLDTPGTTPPAFENQRYAMRMAFVGSINDDILYFDELALALLEQLAAQYPQSIAERYGILEQGLTPLEMLDCVCKRRGFIIRGGEYDYDRACRAVIDDFRSGKLGKITLDDPSESNFKF